MVNSLVLVQNPRLYEPALKSKSPEAQNKVWSAVKRVFSFIKNFLVCTALTPFYFKAVVIDKIFSTRLTLRLVRFHGSFCALAIGLRAYSLFCIDLHPFFSLDFLKKVVKDKNRFLAGVLILSRLTDKNNPLHKFLKNVRYSDTQEYQGNVDKFIKKYRHLKGKNLDTIGQLGPYVEKILNRTLIVDLIVPKNEKDQLFAAKSKLHKLKAHPDKNSNHLELANDVFQVVNIACEIRDGWKLTSS